MFCTYLLRKRYGQLFETHSQIFPLNNVGETILFNFVGKMSQIFGPKLDKVSELYMTVFLILPCSGVLFL